MTPLNLEDFGAVGDGRDCSPAFAAALAALPPRGGSLVLREGVYDCRSPWIATKPITLVGAGPGRTTASGHPDEGTTQLRFAPGVSGIRLAGNAAPYSKLSGLFLRSQSTGPGTDDGIWLASNGCTLDNVSVEGFGRHGITIDTTQGGNANVSLVQRCRAFLNRGDGFRTVGGDANCVQFSSCDASYNDGWGFYDASGCNTWTACHVAANPTSPGSYFCGGTSGLLINPYAEECPTNTLVFAVGSSYYVVLGGAFGAPKVVNQAPGGGGNVVLSKGVWNLFYVGGTSFGADDSPCNFNNAGLSVGQGPRLTKQRSASQFWNGLGQTVAVSVPGVANDGTWTVTASHSAMGGPVSLYGYVSGVNVVTVVATNTGGWIGGGWLRVDAWQHG